MERCAGGFRNGERESRERLFDLDPLSRSTTLMGLIAGCDWKICAAPMDSSAIPPRYASVRTKVGGSCSRHECKAGCMPPQAPVVSGEILA
jgi:hypothetical protein